MKHTTKLAMLAASAFTTLAVAVGAASGGSPATVTLIERTADDQVATTVAAAPSTTVAPVAAQSPTTAVTGPTVAPVTTKLASSAPASATAPATTPTTAAAPATTSTTVVVPTWTVRYLDGSVRVLTVPPPKLSERPNERPKLDASGTRIGTEWDAYSCDPLTAPNYRCGQYVAFNMSVPPLSG